MKNNTNIDENLEGAENFKAWKYKFMLIVEEHDLEGHVKDEVPKPKGDETYNHKKDMIKSKRIINDSIKDHLIPQVSSKKTQRRLQKKCLMH